MLLIIILCTFLVVRYYTLKYGLFIWWPDCLGNTYVNDDTLGTTLKPSSGSPPTPRYSRPCKRQDLPSPTTPRPFQPSRNGGFLRAIRDTRRQSLVPSYGDPRPGGVSPPSSSHQAPQGCSRLRFLQTSKITRTFTYIIPRRDSLG